MRSLDDCKGAVKDQCQQHQRVRQVADIRKLVTPEGVTSMRIVMEKLQDRLDQNGRDDNLSNAGTL